MKIEEVEVHPEMVWVLPIKEKSVVGGMLVGDGTKETPVGLVVKVGSIVSRYFKEQGFDLVEGAEILYDMNRATPVSLGDKVYRAVHYQNIQAFALKEV